MMNDMNHPPEHVITPMEYVTDLALENITTMLEGKIKSLEDKSATPVLERLLEYASLVKEAKMSNNKMLNLIFAKELEMVDKMGFSCKRDSYGQVIFAPEAAMADSAQEHSVKKELTEADYYSVLNTLHKDFRTNGIPDDIALAYAQMKDVLSKMVNNETFFTMAMFQSRPYINNIDSMYLYTQYYSNIQQMLSIRSMLES